MTTWASTDFTGGSIGASVSTVNEPIFSNIIGGPPTFQANLAGTGQAMQSPGVLANGQITLGSRDTTGTGHFRVGVDVWVQARGANVSTYHDIFTLRNVTTNVCDVGLRRNANGTTRQFAARSSLAYYGQVGGIGNTSTGTMVLDNELWHVEMECNGTAVNTYVWEPTNATTTPDYSWSGTIGATWNYVLVGLNSGSSNLTVRYETLRVTDGEQIRTASTPAVGADFSGSGTLTAAVVPSVAVTAALSGTGTLSATTGVGATVTAAFTGTGTLTATAGSSATCTLCMAGAPTADGFATVAKTVGAASVRMVVSTNSGLTSPTYSSPQTPDAAGYSHHAITGLTADTQYHWAIESTSTAGAVVTTHTSLQGKARTVPTGNASFAFWVGSCHDWNGSNVYDHLRTKTGVDTRTALFGIQLGDMGYPYITGGIGTGTGNTAPADTAQIRADRELTITGSLPMALYREVPFHHTYSDCDGAGANSDSTWAAFVGGNVQDAYRQQFANPTLPLADSQARSWVVGRVRFIQTDELTMASARGATDNSSKSKLGTAQKTWFKAEIDAAVLAGQIVIWAGDGPWLGSASTGGTNNTWTAYDTERQELGNYIAASGVHLIRVHGDTHTLWADDGTNNTRGGFPTFSNAPMSTTANTYGGTVSDGKWPTSSGSGRQYGWYEVTDDGAVITVDYAGIAWDSGSSTWVERVSLTLSFASVSATFSGSGTLSAAVVQSYPRTAALSGTGTLSAAVSPRVAVVANLSGSGTLTASSVQRMPVAADFTGTGALSAAAAARVPVTAGFTGTGALSATIAGAANPVTADLSGDGTLTAAVVPSMAVAAAFSGSGTLSAATAVQMAVTAGFSGSGTLAATVVAAGAVVAAFAGSGTLSATVGSQAAVTADFTGTGTLTAATVSLHQLVVAFAGVGTLAALAHNPDAYPTVLQPRASLTRNRSTAVLARNRSEASID